MILFEKEIEEVAMPQKSLSMKKIEEILRLKYEKELTHRAIAKSCGVSTSTVSEYTTRAKSAGLSWPLSEGITTEKLETRLYPNKGAIRKGIRLVPDWQTIHKELKRKGVTLSLLWMEYRQGHPEGYGYSQYCYRYGVWKKQLNPPKSLFDWVLILGDDVPSGVCTIKKSFKLLT